MILYIVVIFFIIIFNVLIPILIQRLKTENSIFESTLGKQLTKVSCINNYWIYIQKTIFGIEIRYFVDKNDDYLTCDLDFNKAQDNKICGLLGEYNNRYHPCYITLTQLLFYRTQF